MLTRSWPLHYHVFNFFVDKHGSAALTVHKSDDNTRYHIIADKDNLPTDTRTGKRFQELVRCIRENEQSESSSKSSGKDSGIDVNALEDAEEDLQSWMLGPLLENPSKPSKTRSELSLKEWYGAPTSFFNLDATDSDSPASVELEPNDDLNERTAKLQPTIYIPKYITKLDLPWYSSDSLELLSTSSSPPPYHPARVRISKTGETCFFKQVEGVAQVTKRELRLLHRVSQPDLKNKVRTPELAGLVSYDDSEQHAIGFLQSEIKDCATLAEKLDPEIAQAKRERWAQEAEAMKEAIHEADVIWGDAKADNFLVDGDGQLWMIDFGGSYTEGWVDEDIKETEEGEDMGVAKVVNGLVDPEANNVVGGTVRTHDASNHAQKPDRANADAEKKSKRKRNDDADDRDADSANKRRKSRSD